MGKYLVWPFLVLHVLVGLFAVSVLWPLLGAVAKVRLERWFAARLMRILGVQVKVDYLGDGSKPGTRQAKLFYSNHVSWLDIFAFNSVSPVTFIAKSEIAQWPLAGILASRSGTLFIERGKRHAVRDVINNAAQRLQAGRDVAVFPEGTTGPGDNPLTFHSNFVQPAIIARAMLVPVSLQYQLRSGEFTSQPAYLGEQSLVENLRVLTDNWGKFRVNLTFHQAIDCTGKTRHEVSAQAYEMIARGCAGTSAQGTEGAGLSTASI